MLTFAGKVMPAEEEVASDFDFWIAVRFKSLIITFLISLLMDHNYHNFTNRAIRPHKHLFHSGPN